MCAALAAGANMAAAAPAAAPSAPASPFKVIGDLGGGGTAEGKEVLGDIHADVVGCD